MPTLTLDGPAAPPATTPAATAGTPSSGPTIKLALPMK
jgi:hypothetical protein